jgi:hypothetical protein
LRRRPSTKVLAGIGPPVKRATCNRQNADDKAAQMNGQFAPPPKDLNHAESS